MPTLNLQFPNGKLEKKEVIADKPTFKLYRLSGNFKSPADLRKYPFDSQELKIVVEDDARGIDQIELRRRSRAHAARARLPRRRLAGRLRRGALARASRIPTASRTTTSIYSRYTFTARRRSLRDERGVQGVRPGVRHRPHLAPRHVGSGRRDGGALERRRADARRRGPLPLRADAGAPGDELPDARRQADARRLRLARARHDLDVVDVPREGGEHAEGVPHRARRGARAQRSS